jgi:hypothetical protein
MTNRLRGWLAAGLILLVPPAVADAAWLGFRNDTRAVIVVQGASLINNKPRWGKPYRLLPGEVYWENILVPGEKVIAVFDPAQGARPVHQENITTAESDQLYSIQVEPPPPPGKGQPPAAPKVKLVPMELPKKPPPKAPPKPPPKR